MPTDAENSRIPQNIINAIKEIGENFVLFRLFLISRNTKWKVYKNYVDSGYDISILNLRENKNIKIEVKTRQRILTQNKNKNNTHFTLTDNEYNSADFLIAYLIHDEKRTDYFIVPVNELKKTKNKNKIVYKFYVTLLKKTNLYSDKCLNYLDRWDLITDQINK